MAQNNFDLRSSDRHFFQVMVNRPLLLMMVVLGLPLLRSPAVGQDRPAYTIGPDDVLSITFWQQPELNQPGVKVRQDGMIALPVIGEIHVAGTTPEEAGNRIASRLSRYNANISQAVVQVVQYNSRKVIVTGQVGAPGRYTYEFIPDLWTVIRDAGGPLEAGDLSKVTTVQPSGTIQVVDLAQILAAGMADTLPALEAGTTVEVPAERYPGQTYRSGAAEEREPVVHVTGEVRTPGTFQMSPGLSIYDAIALAGGFSPDASTKKVTVISHSPGGPVSQPIDLRPDAKKRTGMTYQIQYEDLIIVGKKGPSVGSVVRDCAAGVAIITGIIIVLDYFDRNTGETTVTVGR